MVTDVNLTNISELIDYETINYHLDDHPLWIQNLLKFCVKSVDSIYLPENINQAITQIKSDIYSYIKIGVICDLVRHKNLWENLTNNFGQFCKDYLGKSRWWFDNIINASKVAMNLINSGFDILPKNEAQARPLTSLDYLEQVEVWRNITHTIPEHRIKAKTVKAFVDRHIKKLNQDYEEESYYATTPPKPKQKLIKIDQDSYDLLESKASKYGLTPKQYLDALLQKELGDFENEENHDQQTKINQEKSQEENQEIQPAQAPQNMVKTLPNLVKYEFDLTNKDTLTKSFMMMVATDINNIFKQVFRE